MKKQFVNNNKFILGVCVLVFGILIFAFIPNPVRYVGAILVLLAIINIAFVFFSKDSDSGDDPYKSRIRNQILRHQYKK